MSGEIDANRLADDLEALRTGKIAVPDFRATWQPCLLAEALRPIWGNLEHYLADADIRARDSVYRAMQDDEMQKLVRLLRAGSSAVELVQVTFLGHSRTQD